MILSIEQIKKLRDETGISIGKCKEALEKTQGDVEKAKDILRKSGQEIAKKRSGKDAKDGIVDIYLHANHKLGVMLSLRCESDFVARSEEFQKLAHEVCLQIAAMSPLYLRKEDIPLEREKQEKEIYKEQMKDSDKPKEVLDKIIEGKFKKWQAEVVLLRQPWIKDQGKTIAELLEETVSKLKEKIEISQFVRFEI